MLCLKGCNSGNNAGQRRPEIIFVPPTFGVDYWVNMTLRTTYRAQDPIWPWTCSLQPLQICPEVRVNWPCSTSCHPSWTPPSLGSSTALPCLILHSEKLTCGHHSCSSNKNPAGHEDQRSRERAGRRRTAREGADTRLT